MARKKKRVGGRFGAFISVISMTLVLILLGADVFFVTVASNFSKNLRENFAVEVLLEDNIPQHDLYLLPALHAPHELYLKGAGRSQYERGTGNDGGRIWRG